MRGAKPEADAKAAAHRADLEERLMRSDRRVFESLDTQWARVLKPYPDLAFVKERPGIYRIGTRTVQCSLDKRGTIQVHMAVPLTEGG